MRNPSQVDRIKSLLNDGNYHYAAELEKIAWSKHKRIATLKEKGIEIETRDCIHGISRAFDYKIKDWKPPRVYKPAENLDYHPKSMNL